MNNPGFRVNMDRAIRRRYLTGFIVLYAIWAVTYMAIGAWTSTMRTHSLETALDRAIPFIPEFEFVYILCYLLPFVPFAVRIGEADLRRMIIAFCATSAVAFACFILFPVYCPRPPFAAQSIATSMLALEHVLDRPVNNFPSFHVAVAALVYFGARRASRFLAAALLSITVGIAISALCIKQHFVADVIAGFLLASVCWRLSGRWGACDATASDPSRCVDRRSREHE